MKSIKLLVYTSILVLLTLPAFGQSTDGKALKVNQQRIERRIQELSEFGRDATGKGYRVAYSKGDVAARVWLIDLMEKAGLAVSIDYAGNLIGKRNGKNDALKPIAFGSHIDMVPDGGNYDGCVGSIAALEIMEVLKEGEVVTEHPLEMIIFSNEEGAVFGSRAMVQAIDPDVLASISHSGLSIEEGIKMIGGNAADSELRKSGSLAAFLELHIEQGQVLDQENIQIGVVEGIVGFRLWEIEIEGSANHAGTTPMHLRRDALVAASKLIVMINELTTKMEGDQVATVGQISITPGAGNVIPGKATLSLEIRDLSIAKIETLIAEIKRGGLEIEKSTQTNITFRKRDFFSDPALMDEQIQTSIAESAKSLGLSYKNMPSGAGHDTQEMANIAPVGMIFVPSVNGISHSPKEFTKAADMANGANVLLQTILALDKK